MANAAKSFELPESVGAAVTAGANIVTALRESVGYSVEDLAVTCGLAIGEISAIEAGENAEPSQLRRIATALGLPDEALLPN